MKKISVLIFLILSFSNVFSMDNTNISENTNLPEQFLGIWEGNDRYVFFEKNENVPQKNQIIVVFKTYYGWYLDRVAEPIEKNQIEKRTRNNATPKNPIVIEYEIEQETDEVYNLKLIYSKNQVQNLPVAIINNTMYFNFFQKDANIQNLWNGNDFSKGILVSEQTQNKKLQCLYILNDKCFFIDYWYTDMDFSDSLAYFEYENQQFQINKHVKSMKQVYTCANGKGKRVRNLLESIKFSLDNYIHTENILILEENQSQNIKKLVDMNTFQDLMQIVNSQNSKRKPLQEPPFPPSNVEWHWDLIDLLEKDNQIIQQVRKRQRAFGPRAKDFE